MCSSRGSNSELSRLPSRIQVASGAQATAWRVHCPNLVQLDAKKDWTNPLSAPCELVQSFATRTSYGLFRPCEFSCSACLTGDTHSMSLATATNRHCREHCQSWRTRCSVTSCAVHCSERCSIGCLAAPACWLLQTLMSHALSWELERTHGVEGCGTSQSIRSAEIFI